MSEDLTFDVILSQPERATSRKRCGTVREVEDFVGEMQPDSVLDVQALMGDQDIGNFVLFYGSEFAHVRLLLDQAYAAEDPKRTGCQGPFVELKDDDGSVFSLTPARVLERERALSAFAYWLRSQQKDPGLEWKME